MQACHGIIPRSAEPSFEREGIQSNSIVGLSIDRALSVLGEGAKSTLLFHIAKHFALSQDEFSTKPAALGRALAGILGSGAQVIEGLIVSDLERSSPYSNEGDFVENMVFATEAELFTQKLEEVMLRHA